MRSIICDVMASRAMISTSESIQRLMWPSPPLEHEAMRLMQYSERQSVRSLRSAARWADLRGLSHHEAFVAQSGHLDTLNQCPLLGVKRTSGKTSENVRL